MNLINKFKKKKSQMIMKKKIFMTNIFERNRTKYMLINALFFGSLMIFFPARANNVIYSFHIIW